MAPRRWIGLALGWSLGLAPALLAQEPNCQRRTYPVSVTDRDGNVIPGLTAADFQAEFRGKPAKIVSVQPDDRPHRIVILLDASGSMRGQTGLRWMSAVKGAQELVQSDTGNPSFALWIFQEKVDERIGFLQGNAQVARRLGQIRNDLEFFQERVRGSTALYDTVSRALEFFGPLSAGDVLYVLTDGADNSSRTSVRDLLRKLVASRVRLFVCITLIDPYGHPQRLNDRAKKGLKEIEELAYATGGSYFGPIGIDSHGRMLSSFATDDQAALTNRLHAFNQLLTGEYLLEVDFGGPVYKPREWKLKVVDATGADRKEIRVAYPAELLACSGPGK